MRKKLVKFKENATLKNVIEPGKDLFSQVKGRWHSLVFQNKAPITLEIGCGRGEYAVGLAKLHPNRNFVGVDIKGDRLWYGAQEANQDDLKNVAFLRAQIERLGDFFNENEVEEIWITFPGPRPKNTEIHRRLTHPKFFDLYKKVLKPGGRVRLKTDSDLVYTYTLSVLEKYPGAHVLKKSQDLYHSPLEEQVPAIQTHFEKKFLAEKKPIKYIEFALTKKRFSSIMRSLLKV